MNRAKSILVGVDFSLCSGDALRQAARIAGWNGSTLHVLYVIDLPVYQPTPHLLLPFTLPTQQGLVDLAKLRWEEFAEEYNAQAVKFTVIVGSPRQEILRAVQSTKPDLLVLGTNSNLDRPYGIGTTAAALVRKAETKVLLVREGQRSAFTAVAAFVDFTDTSLHAVEQSVGVAAQDGAELHVVHLYDDPWKNLPPGHVVAANLSDFRAKMKQGVEDRLHDFCAPIARELGALKVRFHGVEFDQRWEGQGQGISGFVRRHGIDLAVLGVRSTWSVRDFLVGSTAERVCRDAGCSILSVRPVNQGANGDK